MKPASHPSHTLSFPRPAFEPQNTGSTDIPRHQLKSPPMLVDIHRLSVSALARSVGTRKGGPSANETK
jgi:hypothetical protein